VQEQGANVSADRSRHVDQLQSRSAALQPEARAKLDEFAKALKDSRLKADKFIVEGHTDASGSAIYNEGLSNAGAIRDGIPSGERIESSRIKAIGMEAKPIHASPIPTTPSTGGSRCG
jgi:outer membrane protein OmpA-like peptidoglycan-associated protein